jgi:hypothetical protein
MIISKGELNAIHKFAWYFLGILCLTSEIAHLHYIT